MTVSQFRRVWNRLPQGWLSLEEALLLTAAAQVATRSNPLIEVGSYYGRASVLLAESASNMDLSVYCIDPWEDCGDFRYGPNVTGEEVYQAFLENTKGYPKVYHKRMRVEDWHPIPADFVYLDGDHSYKGTLAQCQKALECRPYTIAAHDVNDTGGGMEVKRAVLEVLGPWSERVEKLAVWRLK